MPPFRLGPTAKDATYHRKPQIIYTKNSYSEGVKVEHWQELMEHHPVDVDPFCQGKVNYFLSHYHRLGASDDNSFRTTTRDMLEQRFIEDKMIPNKLFGNFRTYYYSEQGDCGPKQKESPCPAVSANTFMTTMQHSYQMPRPYVMQRLAFPKIPFMRNRKYRHEDPNLSADKFYGENFHYATCQMRMYKGSRSVSFNPMTGEYTKVPN